LKKLSLPFAELYRRPGNPKDLDAAKENIQKAIIGYTQEAQQDQADCFHHLAAYFTNRYQRLGDMNDLDAALQSNQKALDLNPEAHPNRA
ncbi:hypothetical protein DFH09DRAFT_830170, partial [Mycena vulgaris]